MPPRTTRPTKPLLDQGKKVLPLSAPESELLISAQTETSAKQKLKSVVIMLLVCGLFICFGLTFLAATQSTNLIRLIQQQNLAAAIPFVIKQTPQPTMVIPPTTTPTLMFDQSPESSDSAYFSTRDNRLTHVYPSNWTLYQFEKQGNPGYFGGSVIDWWSLEKTIPDNEAGRIQINFHFEENLEQKTADQLINCQVTSGCTDIVINTLSFLTNTYKENDTVASSNLISIFDNKILYVQTVSQNASSAEYSQISQILASIKLVEASDSAKPDTHFCGGIAAIQCPEGYECVLDGNYPDAGGTCVINQ